MVGITGTYDPAFGNFPQRRQPAGMAGGFQSLLGQELGLGGAAANVLHFVDEAKQSTHSDDQYRIHVVPHLCFILCFRHFLNVFLHFLQLLL